MAPETAPPVRAEAEWAAAQRQWTQGWRRLVLLALPLVYLIYVAGAVRDNSHGAAAVAGYAVLAAFAVCWLAMPLVLPPGGGTKRWFWGWYAILAALLVAELPFARAAGFVLAVFLTIVTVARLGARSAPAVAAFALAALLVPVWVRSWHVGLVGSFDDVTPVAIPVVALTIFVTMQVVRSNRALAQARAELARLAAENERIRIARDLHDLLGHSLTTITVKAGLARKLGADDPGRAVSQIAEVEELSRRALADVRAAVSSYRDVTLAGELARGRELLRAAGITPDLPTATDLVDPAGQELFGWAVREGITNVVRHSRASVCVVRLTPSCVEITDDGAGAGSAGPAGAGPEGAAPEGVGPDGAGTAGPAGNGLRGLRERAAALGGTVDAGPVHPRGWRLRVRVPVAGPPPPAGGAPPVTGAAPVTIRPGRQR